MMPNSATQQNFNNPYEIIRINQIFDSFLQELKPVFNDLPFNIAEENIQSRIRGNLLMAIVINSGILLNTSNKVNCQPVMARCMVIWPVDWAFWAIAINSRCMHWQHTSTGTGN